MIDPTVEKEAVIKTHDEYLRLSEIGMTTQERVQIKLFKDTLQYDKCITVLNCENWEKLSEKEKQEYANNTDPCPDPQHQHIMTREEVD